MTFEQIMQKENFFPNEEQLPVIQSDVNTVVSAGAGAGKTAVLSWRFLRLVMECSVKPEEILTLTFTKKAASEMRERIYRRLLDARDSLPSDTFESFSRSTISTLDSFCAQIVRSDSITYGLPRDIAVISDDDLADLAQRIALQFLSDPENSKERDVIASLLMPSDLMDRFFLIIARETSLCGDYDAKRVTASFLSYIRTVYEDRMGKIGVLLDRLGSLSLKGRFSEQYDHIFDCYRKRQFGPDDYFKLNGVKDEEVKEIVGLLKPFMGKDSGLVLLQDLALGNQNDVSYLQNTLGKYSYRLNQEKKKHGTLTFRDMAELAVRILRDNLQVRNLFKRRFKQIMVDEFQDNNMLQRDLVFLLAEKESLEGTAGKIPTIDELEPSKLFFVGDEKQSIYKFRGADVSVFRRLQTEVSKNGKALILGTNYRSQSRLISHFNQVFESVLEDSGKDFEARFSPIKAGREADATQSRIIFAVYNREMIEEEELKDGVLEAEAIGDYCNRILYTDEFLVNGKRPQPSDIAILFGTASNQMNIEKALKRRGIEYQIAETRSLMLDAVASDFYSFINVLLYPEDTRSLAALLKSPFCGLCEESIENVLSGSDVLDVDCTRYQAFTTFLESVRESAFRLTISQLLEKLFIEGGYKAYLMQDTDRLPFEEHYNYLFCYAVQYDREGRSLSDYSRFLRNNLGQSAKLPEANVLHATRNGVQIMSVHKSKGLEFKVVIYSGVGNKGANDRSSYVFNINGDLVANENREIQKILDLDRKEREEAELRRLMYVAFTRAKDHLIVIGGYKGNSMADVFSWYLTAINGNLGTLECTMEGVTMEDVGSTQRLSKRSSQAVFPLSWADKPVEFESRSSRIGVTSLEEQEREIDGQKSGIYLPILEVDSIIRQSSLNDKFGTLCHAALEMLLTTDSLDSLECKLTESERDNAKLLRQAKDFAHRFVESRFYKDHVDGRRYESELRFYTCMGESGDMALEGVMDLIVFGEKYNLVVDYKTDRTKDPQIHKKQITTYVRVAEQLFGKKCYGVLYYLRDGSLGEFWDSEGNIWETDSKKWI